MAVGTHGVCGAGGPRGETQAGGQGRRVSHLRSDGRIRHWHGQAAVGDGSWGAKQEAGHAHRGHKNPVGPPRPAD